MGEFSQPEPFFPVFQQGRHSIIGAGALVKEGQQIPENSLAVGSPARIIRKCSEEQVKEILENAAHYAQLGSEYKKIDV